MNGSLSMNLITTQIAALKWNDLYIWWHNRANAVALSPFVFRKLDEQPLVLPCDDC